MLLFSALHHNQVVGQPASEPVSLSIILSVKIEKTFGFHRNCSAALVGEWKRKFGFINSLATSSERIQIELSTFIQSDGT